MKARKLVAWCWAFGMAVSLQTVSAAGKDDDKDKVAPPRETISKPLSEKERKRREAKLRKELETPYKKWLQEDVAYIISDEEKQAFKRLQTDEERDQFIEQFWLRRDPTPDTMENEFKEEHYRRIAYANERYASGFQGWKSDRGRIYIMYGPPDEIESHPSGGAYTRPMEEGGGQTSTYPFEQWRYRYIEGIGSDVILEFVDPTMSGEYHLALDPGEKDALAKIPNAGLTQWEALGMANKSDRFTRTDGTTLGMGANPTSGNNDQFERLSRFFNVMRPPKVKYTDLEAMVDSRITYNLLPIKVRADFLRMTDTTVQANIAVQFDYKDLQFQDKAGVSKAVVNMYARITSMGRRVVNVWEEPVTVEVPTSMLGSAIAHSAIYGHSVFLAPGNYRLNVVAKDVIGGTVNNYEVALRVPRFEEDKLASSSVLLADLIESLPTRSVGAGQFVIGDSKVRPRLNDTFRRSEKMGIYFQLYNFGADEKTQKPNGQIQYEITKVGSNKSILDFSEDVIGLPGASAQQVTVEKILPLAKLEPGQYTLKMKVTDKIRNQVLTPSATFTVN